jgi:transmembrane sensor
MNAASSLREEPDIHDEVAALWLKSKSSAWTATDEASLQCRLASEPEFAEAYKQARLSWQLAGRHATTPELMAFRETAIARARAASARRWALPSASFARFRKAGLLAACLVGLAVAWQLSPYGYQPGTYSTGLGEQKMVELADHSHLVLNARTKLKVRFSTDIRSIELLEGQAQFSVAKDPARPFKVHAGSKTVVAVGTVFDVQLIDNEFEVSMLEGRVAVLSATEVNSLSAAAIPLELSTGEALYVHADGEAAVVKADIEAATAWRQGKVIFRDEPMSEAVHRLNRYSRQQVVIDDVQLGRLKVSGVFDSDDTQAFAEAMQSYLPVTADLSRRSVIHLRLK